LCARDPLRFAAVNIWANPAPGEGFEGSASTRSAVLLKSARISRISELRNF
jgi:hypothetical protein